MSMHIVETGSSEEFVKRAVQCVTGVILESQKDPDHRAIIGLSGGTTPVPVYEALAKETEIEWKRVLFFLTDERYVSPESPDSNQKMVRETLGKGPSAKARFLFPDVSLPIDDCIRAYDESLKDMKPDLVILGMGSDGHIASLFPPVGPEAYGPARAIRTTTDAFAVHDRISLTFPPLADARRRLFLIAGPAKKALLKKMQEVGEDVSLYPAQYLFDERTTWIVGP